MEKRSKVKETIRQMMLNSEFGQKQVRFSVTLQEQDDKRLKYMADMLGVSKSAVANDLLSAAIDDMEEELGLDRKDRESDYYKKVWADWLGDTLLDETKVDKEG